VHYAGQAPAERTSGLELRILGPVEASRAGVSVSLGGAKQRAVLAMLLLDAGRVLPSDRLTDELWLGQPPPGAASTLRSYISRLRGLLSPDATLMAHRGGYVLELERAWVDAASFEGLVKEGQAALKRGNVRVAAERFRHGLALWRGRALTDVMDVETLALESRRLDELRIEAIEGRTEAELALGLHAELVGELERLVAEHPFREGFWRQLVLALYRCERQADALARYSQARSMLAEELGLEPSEELRQLEQAVLRHEVPPVPASRQRHNVPAQLTTLVGRDGDVRELERLLVQARLLTLTGVGGVGKTRLALELAGRLVDAFADGVWLIDLTAVSNPALVPQSVAEVLGVREGSDRSIGVALLDHLREAELLLVLDNCEHLLSSCADLAQYIVRGSAGVKVVATSREPLGVPGEVEYDVRPLAVPAESADVESVMDYASVRLFFERLAATRGLNDGKPETINTVAAICRELDGLPLAIELAAARTKALSVAEIAARLDDRFRFLRYWRPVADPRHQTLKATMDWSYTLLSDEEARILRELAVFAGGFDLDAVASMCSDGDRAAALDLVQRLVEKSLVIAESRPNGTRYRLLETVRQYADGCLAEAGHRDDVRRRHAAHFVGLAENDELARARGKEPTPAKRLDQDVNNLRAAIAWSEESADTETMLRLAAALWRFWDARGYLREGREVLERAVLQSNGAEPSIRAKALEGLCVILRKQGLFEDATAMGRESAALWRESGDGVRLARSLNDLGLAQMAAGHYHEASATLEESAALATQLGDEASLADALQRLGNLCQHEGDYNAARPLHDRSLQLHRRVGDAHGEARSMFGLALTALMQGEAEIARSLFTQVLVLGDGIQDVYVVMWSLEGLAAVAAQEEASERAARLLGAAAALRESGGAILAAHIRRALHEPTVTAIRHALGARADEFQADGRAMALPEAVRYATAAA
jgi:predicted ATPase/DNA-binding SARP family transcriptional activator